MKKNIIAKLGLMVFTLGFTVVTARAEMKLEEAYFEVHSIVKPGANHSQVSIRNEISDGAAGVNEYYFNGKIFIKSFDSDNYGKETIVIPAQLKVENWGFLASYRAMNFRGDAPRIPIEFLSGNQIGDLFAPYHGGELDFHLGLGTVYKRLFNAHGLSLKGWNFILGFGFNLSYIRMTLSPGRFIPGKETRIEGITRIQQAGQVIETQQIDLNSLRNMQVP